MKTLITNSLICLSLCAFGQNNIVWNASAEISSLSSYGNNFPRIAMDGSGNPMVTWSDATNMFFAKWNGSGFDTPIQINPPDVNIAGPYWMGPDIASKGDTLYAVYKETPETDTSSHIWCVGSFDGGMTFGNPVRVDYIGTHLSRFCTVAVDDGGHPLIAFMELNEAMVEPRWVVVRSSDFGNSFGSPVLGSGWSGETSEACDCCPSKIISSGSIVALPYRDNSSNIRDTWAGISTDGGSTFEIGVPVDQQNWLLSACPSSGPDGVIVGDTLITTFMSGASGGSRVYYSKTSITAMTGSMAIPLDQTTPVSLNQQNFPRVDYHEGAMAFAWKQVSGGTQELAIQFTENISEGINPIQEIVDQDHIGAVDVALFDGKIWVIWEDQSTGTVWYRSGTYSDAASMKEQQSVHFSVYPNPGQSYWTINAGEFDELLDVRIISATGLLIGDFYSEKHGMIKIDNSNLPSGIYFARIKAGNGINATTLIKD